MARVNISLPDTLYRAAKAERMPISQICQQALRAELTSRQRERNARGAMLWQQSNTIRRP